MADLPKRIYDKYKKEAEDHANFLCDEIFKPAFIIAYLHGAKHMRDELLGIQLSNEKEK